MRGIIINGRFLLHRVTGVERYAREILSELDKLIEPDEIEIAIPPEVTDLPSYNNIRITRIGKLHNRLWEHISFPLYVKKKRSLSLNLCNVAPLLAPGIVCIHDVKIRACPQYFSRKFVLWYRLLFSNACKRANTIITVSQFSKKEIVKYFKIAPNQIDVIPNAWQHYERIDYNENTLTKYGLKRYQYFFSVCSLEPNKNIRWIAEAAKDNSDQVFVVAGAINKTIFADGLGFECPENMMLIGYVSDEEAKTLMRDSKAFLFPTFYEGFGIPPLEALSAGCKSIIVSDTEVMHEIFGDDVGYINPYKYVHTDFREMKRTDSSRILDKYSWKKSARALHNIIKTVEGDS